MLTVTERRPPRLEPPKLVGHWTAADFATAASMVGELTLTDLFAGCGGSSQGARSVPGVRVRIAANHWRLAVDSHQANFPDADHDCADVSQVDFRRYPATDLLHGSPECTNQTGASGKSKKERNRANVQPDMFDDYQPAESDERSRATMWDMPRALEVGLMRGRPYKGFIVENVLEMGEWLYWRAWQAAVGPDGAGYCIHVVSLNSAHAQAAGMPAPQSRDRGYVLGHLPGIPCPNLEKWVGPKSWCAHCDGFVQGRQQWKKPGQTIGWYGQYVYVCSTPGCGRKVEPAILPAVAALDLTRPGTRIGDRKRPLADATMRRIGAGRRRFWSGGDVPIPPLLIPTGGGWNDTAWPATLPMRTRTTRESEGVLVPPFTLHTKARAGDSTRSGLDVLRTQTGQHEQAMVCPPFITELRGGGSTARPVLHPLSTVSAQGNHHYLTIPPGFVQRHNNHRGDPGSMCTPLAETLRTLTTTGHQSLVTWDGDHLVYAYDTGSLRPVMDVLPTATAVAGDALIGDAPGDVMDCLFRMLFPEEIGLGMGFEPTYEVLGVQRDRVKQYGNAVTPPAERDLMCALVEAVSGVDLERAA